MDDSIEAIPPVGGVDALETAQIFAEDLRTERLREMLDERIAESETQAASSPIDNASSDVASGDASSSDVLDEVADPTGELAAARNVQQSVLNLQLEMQQMLLLQSEGYNVFDR